MIDTSKFNVLFADSFGYRHQQIRIRSGTTGRHVAQTHVHNIKELMEVVSKQKFEVAFIAGYFERHDSIKDLIQFFCKLSQELRPDLVIFHGTTDEQKLVKQLRSVGYIVTHIPWDFMDPSKHIRQDPEDYFPKEESLQQLLLPAYTAERA